MAVRLRSLDLRGFKTYRELENFHPGPLSVLVGANGSGKSNLVSFFTFLNRMMADPGELQLAIAEAGGARRILHDGPKHTRSMQARLELETEEGAAFYEFELAYAANDSLIFAEEKWGLREQGRLPANREGEHSGLRESSIHGLAIGDTDEIAKPIRRFLRDCVVYQFHDTSFTSGMRGMASRADGRFLHRDGSNLAAYLLRLSGGCSEQRQAYKRIQDCLRQVIPFFAEFVLEPENGHVLLQWRERGSDVVFSAAQASDGMLRIVALMTLLCQPTDSLPSIMMLDEPELGLHPQAVMLVGALIRQVAGRCQVMVATQSVTMVDEFSLDEIVVVSRPGRESTLRRLKSVEYEAWLQEYTAGELWRKNVLEGGPGR